MAPDWVMALPAVNASLNGLATILLAAGFVAIKAKRPTLHRNLMYSAFAVSILFLACYLTYHFALDHYTGEKGKKFPGTGTAATIYYAILITHVILAVAVPFLSVATIYQALRQRWDTHRRLAKITFPIWMYVSVTGVVIYLMLYQMGF
ncbi:DUF420 domain-containing protein [Calycomorphotria hydatis]|uniref:DUF420 domain-containing protein n=1 Tax=Calycomorphotria hydatis TaxID=2528027 RepID=UPI0018D20220|nr:DUF420 domain-containing protein [Calycomorphotria hydatis]